ncbi:MAG: hypothetical protein HYX76_12160 [Acidobacteria bacterium]|nr:hypothetical protein [Acidobacteriota bacterium]
MIDREKVLTILQKRFPGASTDQIAAAANAIVGLEDEWQEVTSQDTELGYHVSVNCADICYLAEEAQAGAEFRIFRRKVAVVEQ